MTITAKENTVHQDDNEHTRRVEVDDQNIVDIIVLLESINFVLFYFIFLFIFFYYWNDVISTITFNECRSTEHDTRGKSPK